MMSVPNFQQCSVLVVGDVMLDRYWRGGTDRISPEAPVPVVKHQASEDRLGGAANVALNCQALGTEAAVCGAIGKDDNATIFNQLLATKNLSNRCTAIDNFPTITKLRVMSRNQQLLRIDSEEALATAPAVAMLAELEQQFDHIDAIVLSDYNKGVLQAPQPLIQAATAANIPVLIDPKGSDFEKYRGATIITPNRSEFEAIVGACETLNEVTEKADTLRQQLALTAILVTLSEQGMLLVEKGKPALHLPASAREVFDVTGAGDTVIATLAACIAKGLPLSEAATLANQAAAIVVGKLGTATVSHSELAAAIKTHNQHKQSVVSETVLLQQVATAKAAGERIVMTNGCFDLLHPGHLAYLQEAAALGDRLIVAVNSDNSVKRLKGDSRPINPLQDRLQMLAGIKGVDWVVPFEEDTPQRLIAEVLPHILVKGGDYQPQDIAGYTEVTANGGQVEILSFLPGYSSTALISKIKSS